MKNNSIYAARKVLSREIEGLEALSDSLGKSFEDAVELIYSLKGHVITSGMGKSGHIANKIAATFASTGTPSFFIHPSEASHGDLGMIRRDDALLLLSNSGETPELSNIITFAKRFSIPLIGIARRKKSLLLEQADIGILLPEIPEACDVDAPTTSTTMMIALGDALAVSLIEKRSFTAADFRNFHPGGRLGQRFTRVSDIMHKEPELPLCDSDSIMSRIIIEMTSRKFGCVGITENDKLIGVVTDGDLRRHMSKNLLEQEAIEVMSKNPTTIKANALVQEALGIMNNKKITALFVIDEKNRPIGIVHIHDCLRVGAV